MKRALRDAWIAAHVTLITFMALPAVSRPVSKSDIWDPTVRAEIVGWASTLRRHGYRPNNDRVIEGVWEVANLAHKGRAVVLAPFDPYSRWLGTWQAWRMFVAPQRFPVRFSVEVQVQGLWRVVYRDVGPESWGADLLRGERGRSLVFSTGWTGAQMGRERFGRWLANEVLGDHPEATAARVRYQRVALRPPADVIAGTPERVTDDVSVMLLRGEAP